MAENAHHSQDMWVFPRAPEVTEYVTRKTFTRPGPVTLGLALTGALLVLGIIGFVMKAAQHGFDDHSPWGYYAATFSFVFMVTSTGPLAAAAFRITKSHWRRPLSRVSEIFGIIGIFNILLFIPLAIVLPSLNNPDVGHHELALRRSIWFEGPIGSPLWWDLFGVIFVGVNALALLWLSAVPDMAEAYEKATGFRRSLYRMLAGFWKGTKRQWLIHKAGLALLGAWYFMLLLFVHFIISSDYGQSMIPGWKDAIFPVVYSLSGFQSALGLILIIMFILRRFGGYQEYIGISPFWSASKLLLAFSLLWCYHMFAFGITYWYGRTELEQNVLKYLLFGSYGGVFAGNFFFSFVMPFLVLLWNPVRKTDWGPALAGASALAGAFLFNIRIFVGSFNAGNVYGEFLTEVPPPVYPGLSDILIVIGGIGGAAFIYLLATRVIPVISLWEIKEGLLYQKMETFIRGRYLVLAKPE